MATDGKPFSVRAKLHRLDPFFRLFAFVDFLVEVVGAGTNLPDAIVEADGDLSGLGVDAYAPGLLVG